MAGIVPAVACSMEVSGDGCTARITIKESRYSEKIYGYDPRKGERVIENITENNPVFSTGQIVATRSVFERMQEYPHFTQFVNESLQRHINGDWGDLGEEDKQQNDVSLNEGYRLLSAYEKNGLPKIWIITEADRSATTILFPEEY